MSQRVLLPSLFLLALGAAGCGGSVRGGGGGGGGGGENIDAEWLAADDDGDGVTNGDEQELGSDPDEVDSDGDGYEDGWEVTEGSDPTDPDDRVYEGNWPYNPDKDSIEGTSFGVGAAAIGDVIPRFVQVDQFGDEVDLYDFAVAGKPMVIDLAALWCGPCNQMSAWLDGDDNGMLEPAANPIREALWAGEFYWVTVLFQDENGEPADAGDAAHWFSDYPTDNVVIMIDPDEQLTSQVNPEYVPSLSLVNADLEWEIVDDANLVLNWLVQNL